MEQFPIEVNMTPEELRRQLEQLKQLRDSFVPAANEAARQSRLGTNNEKYIPNKASGGTMNQDAMRLALMPKIQQHSRPVTHAHHLEIEERPL